ncbi:hypothetical protein SHJG_0292 [Streptomyces hygroscopicus subsp. jinggangensis 5008]|uniref:Right-handed parallel beta-helix repeat-containing protein n=1 Tax=Streptomyces hygroscopicus subsp. jinggangensis TaxID=311982 RepID=Q1L2J4_STRHY|nr:unknown [Streptomyces hygroscopicus subsp. jinggangensis]AEY85570.1 hypothetical protein SHJG_0292 [Streptomyces hygroscopicus subsp. jinggangensis 5008]AGF59792.1 hypothetical protein SHJGH_0126 [Streptomyces hygroscopicus subsp. jinggangensis TL01]
MRPVHTPPCSASRAAPIRWTWTTVHRNPRARASLRLQCGTPDSASIRWCATGSAVSSGAHMIESPRTGVPGRSMRRPTAGCTYGSRNSISGRRPGAHPPHRTPGWRSAIRPAGDVEQQPDLLAGPGVPHSHHDREIRAPLDQSGPHGSAVAARVERADETGPALAQQQGAEGMPASACRPPLVAAGVALPRMPPGAGPVADLTIRVSTCRRPSTPVVLIAPTNTVLDPAHPVHRNVTISGNVFEDAAAPAVRARSVRGLAVTGNHLTGTGTGAVTESGLVAVGGCSDVVV